MLLAIFVVLIFCALIFCALVLNNIDKNLTAITRLLEGSGKKKLDLFLEHVTSIKPLSERIIEEREEEKHDQCRTQVP